MHSCVFHCTAELKRKELEREQKDREIHGKPSSLYVVVKGMTEHQAFIVLSGRMV